MQAILRKSGSVTQIYPVSGRFAGRLIAHAERVGVRVQDCGKWDVPVTVRSVWGLVIIEEGVHNDVDSLRALSLLGFNKDTEHQRQKHRERVVREFFNRRRKTA